MATKTIDDSPRFRPAQSPADKDELVGRVEDQVAVLKAISEIDFVTRARRRHIAPVLKDNPGLAPHVLEAIDEASEDALDDALDDGQIETGLPAKTFDARCPYDWDALLMRPVAFDASRSPES
ncbi:MAG: hypothetical protein JWR29_313 [Tardiphaga sp.]|nr:hypothetical protein [Tardiphaga sp.]